MSKFKLINKIFISSVLVVAIAFLSGYTIEKQEQFKAEKKASINQINVAIQEQDENAFVQAVGNLEDKISFFNEEDLAIMLEDETLNTTTKVTVIQFSEKINDGKGIKSFATLQKYLKKGSLPEEVRISLIEAINNDDTSLNKILSEIVKTEDGSSVVRSMYKLEQTDAKTSLNLANQILNDTDEYSDDTIRSAIKVKSDYYKELFMINSKKDVAEEKEKFIKQSLELYLNSNDRTFKDTLAFALINMQDFNAVKKIILSEEFDNTLKISCVSSNKYTFLSVINGNPTMEDVEVLIKALEIAPLKDLAKPMRDKILSNKAFYDHFGYRLHNVIATMEAFGVDDDSSKFERTPTSNWLE